MKQNLGKSLPRMTVLLASAAIGFTPLPAAAQGAETYPAKPLRLVVNFAPGGTVDIMGRMVAQKLSESVRQPVVVENRPGAGGNIGAEAVARASPDGYSLLMTNGGTLTTNPHLFKAMPFDAMRDFAAITQVARFAPLLIVKSSLPVRTAPEFLAYARANPGKLSFSSAGNGSTSNITGEMLNRLAGVKTTHVPYKGLGPALNDVIAGQVDFLFADGGAHPHIQSGKVRLIAVGSTGRVGMYPDAPTLIESGVPGFSYDAAHVIVVPAATSKDIVARLNREIVRILRLPDIEERIRASVADVVANSAEDAAANLRAEHDRVGRLIRELNIRTD